MSITVKLHQIQIPKCKGEKFVKVTFRGVSRLINLPDDGGLDRIIVDQTTDWPIARPVDDLETVTIELYLRNRLFNDKLLGSYRMSLQKAVEDGIINVTDNLVDTNNKTLEVVLEFSVYYAAPDTSSLRSMSVGTANDRLFEDEERMLMDIESNIANIERNIFNEHASTPHRQGLRKSLMRGMSLGTPDKCCVDRKRSTLKSVRSLIRFGKQRPSKDSDTEDEVLIVQSADSRRSSLNSNVESWAGSNQSIDSTGQTPILDDRQLLKQKELKNNQTVEDPALKAQDFQVCITIIEARQLAGLNMDPVVAIQIGDQKKFTSVKESTNCPYYNEYFVFDFHMPPVMLFDKIIHLSVLQSRNFLRGNKMLGNFKLDVATVWAQPDHQFYHKWALLSDPDDIAGGPKGYLKCDISVIGKGDTVKVPSKSEKDDDDIEANLLLPDGVPTDRQTAHFIVKIYRADGLPKMNSSLMASVKKAFIGEVHDLVDPYVQVSFAGLVGKTSVKKGSYAPVWNEQLIFTEMFPPLCQRIKIQLRDDDPVKPTVIGTHFIDLKTISNDGEKGFMPTFGPNYIHMYGSTRDYSIIDEHSNLNTGLGEGVSYRARLLVSIRTEITDNIDLSPAAVHVEPTAPINEESYAKNEEFFLFATVFDASMIDKKLGDKPVYFEISIGNAGNAIDGQNTSANEHESDSDELETVTTDVAFWQSTTQAIKPMTHDKLYYFLPYWDNKPCMHIRSVWPDYRRRMYNSNIIAKIADKLEDGLDEVNAALDRDDPDMEFKLKHVLEDLALSCGKYVTMSRASTSGPGCGKTKLDKERLKLCQREVENIGNAAKNLKALVTKSSFKERVRTAQTYLVKLKFLIEDPQHSLPDIFFWMICGGKRRAYQRIRARDIVYSIVDEERGKDCGRVKTTFLKLPGKRNSGPSGWTIPAKVQVYLWLGMLKHKKNFVLGIPKGYEMSQELKNVERPKALPPSVIHYVEKHTFQLRAHIYQARSLIGSDSSGLSDPFARVIAGEFCKATQVIDETLSPTWDELLVFDEILVFGSSEEIKQAPPSLVIEIFDQDQVGKSEFIGRTMAKPHVKLKEDQYVRPTFPPPLEWFTIARGVDHAGELLAAFELLEIYGGSDSSLPDLPKPKDIPIFKETDPKQMMVLLPVPREIRPTLTRYRIEVLFWGLRDLKRIHLLTVDKPRVDIECSGHILYSSIISNIRKNPNFSTPVKYLEVDLPEQELYRPPLTIRVVDCRSFGRYTLVGTHVINSIHKYMFTLPTTKKEREAEERRKSSWNQFKTYEDSTANHQEVIPSLYDLAKKERSPLLPKDLPNKFGYGTQKCSKKTRTGSRKRKNLDMEEEQEYEDEEHNKDWWTKYFASVERMIRESNEGKAVHLQNDQTNNIQPLLLNATDKDLVFDYNKPKFGGKSTTTAGRIAARLSPKSGRRKCTSKPVLFKVYPTELETRPEFEEFKEWLKTFELYRGKKTSEDNNDENRVVGYFKGAVNVYKWPLPKDADIKVDAQYGLFSGLPSNDPIKVLVRVYVVKANDLHPMDLNGKADPYVVLHLGSKRISDKDNYISKQLNPVFGKCFEIEATIPQDSVLTVQVFDWDLLGSDDMIGETKIDLENRFYSKHRATCGLPEKYELNGFNAWRDAMKPTQILAKLCKEAKFDLPVYSDGQIKIGNHIYHTTEHGEIGLWGDFEEHAALQILHRWQEIPKIGCHLVPEHVETRPLYNPDKPGIEQGKLEMWVDMFPMDMPLPGPPIDISPRKPKSYELRVIIWNTDDVVLEDDAFFTGEKMSDIYVKGWLKGQEDCQSTDIHYRSLTGEGNFNWRFIFPFEYLVAEQKIVITRKESLFSWDETECKIPARLELQVWDADHFSADDFLGAVTLDLNRFPRGAKSSKLCTLDMLKPDDHVPTVNIFKQRRIKGWWPFYVKKENEEMELTGKVEAEIHLLTSEEAEKLPAGLGRGEPDPLEKPNRPDSSFMWFMNPIKSIRYILWHNYKWTILKLLIIVAVAMIILIFFYSIPGYTVKKLLGA